MNLNYPPALAGQAIIAHEKDEVVTEEKGDFEEYKDRVAALNQSLVR